MEFYPESSGFSSLQQFLDELASLITAAVKNNESPWLSITTLDHLFRVQHGCSIEDIVQTLGCSVDLRSLLRNSHRFAIYPTPNPQDFYVAILEETIPGGRSQPAKTIRYRIKRPWKVDGRLTRMLKAEGAQEIPSRWSAPSKRRCRPQKASPNLMSDIRSAKDLELALIDIAQLLGASDNPVGLATLCNKFCEYHGPIRPVMRRVGPDMKIVNYLRTISVLEVQAVNGTWQIVLKKEGPCE